MASEMAAVRVGPAIRALRGALGLSLEQMSRDVGVSWSTLQRWEAGTSAPSSPLRARLRLYLHTPHVARCVDGDVALQAMLAAAELV